MSIIRSLAIKNDSYFFSPLSNFQVRGNDERRKYEAERYDETKQLFQNHGEVFREDRLWKYVLGVRKETYSSKKDKINVNGLYDDYIWVVFLDRNGVKCANGYDVNTESSAQYEGRQGADADGDKRKDLGRLPLGIYEYYCSISKSEKLGLVFRPVNDSRLERDINHDGYFTDADVQLIKYPNLMSDDKTILFHKGGSDNTWSAGCQTFSSVEFARFKLDMANRNKSQQTFKYLLVRMRD